MIWATVIAAAVGCYLLKLAGVSLPAAWLQRPDVQRVAGLLPVALLGGVGAGAVALLLRAPFLVVIVVAAVTTAVLRALT